MFSRTVGDTFDETMDPYCFSDRHWIDDIRQWLAVNFPAIYTHLIDTPGGYTRKKLKAFKCLEAPKYFTRYNASQSFTWSTDYTISIIQMNLTIDSASITLFTQCLTTHTHPFVTEDRYMCSRGGFSFASPKHRRNRVNIVFIL